MEKFARWLIFMTLLHCSLAGTVSFMGIYLLDKNGDLGSPLNEQGALPFGVTVNLTISGEDLQAGNTIVLSSDMDVFKSNAPGITLSASAIDGSGKRCDLAPTASTTKSLTLSLRTNNGQCFLPRGVKFSFTLPGAFLAPNPVFPANTFSPGTLWYIRTPGSASSVRVSYSNAAIIYVNAEPRLADDSDAYLAGGGTPGFLRVGFTPTADLGAQTQITITSNVAIFRRLNNANSFTITIGNTGCTATPQTTTQTGTTSSIRLTLAGANCNLAANVAVDPSDLRIPATALGPLPLSTAITVTVTAVQGNTQYLNGNLNPDSFSTNNGCGPWGAWAACSATCGGTTSRSRVSVGACAATTQSRACNSVACACTAWSAWSACSATCGGTVTRTRTGSSRPSCNVATVETLPCGPQNCNCPYTESAPSSSCGSGVRTRTVNPRFGWSRLCGPLSYQVVCNDTFTPEAAACPCQDLTVAGAAWKDKNGNTCANYVNNRWCTTEGGYGPNWPTSFRSFEAQQKDGQTAVSACCGCGKNKCVKDTVLLIDQSASIADSDWVMIKQYITDRVEQTPFTDQYGNRIGVVGFDVAPQVLCPMTWEKDALKQCVAAIEFASGPGTATAGGLDFAGAMLGNFSSPSRTRVIEMLTDGSPNRPTNEDIAIPLAYNAAWRLKDQGITILTLGMGTACTPAKPNDCLNREVLDTMASEPTANYAMLLDNYESLAALSLFISQQCKPTLETFDPSPSPIVDQCKDLEDAIPRDYLMQPIGCKKTGTTELLRRYECSELSPGCGSYKCNQYVPPTALQELGATCDTA